MPGIGIGISPFFKRNGFSFSSYWATRLPYFALPTTGVNLLVGEAVTIYGDSLITAPLHIGLTVTYTCDIGTQSGNNYSITPVVGDIGNHNIQIVIKTGSYTVVDETIALSVKAKIANKTVNVLMIGDSTLAGDIEEIGTQLEADLPNNTFTYLGTEGTTRKHEAYTGSSYSAFVTDAASPFVKAGVLNIPAYFTDNSIAIPDVVYIRLGVNDIYHLNTTTIAAIISDIDDFVDGFLAYDPQLRVIIALPTICSSSEAVWNTDNDEVTYPQDDYNENMHHFWEHLVANYANGTHNARVGMSYEAIFLNRDSGYTNSLHLTSAGNAQIGTGLACYLNDYLLIPTRIYADATRWMDFRRGVAVSGADVLQWDDRRGPATAYYAVSSAPQLAADSIVMDGALDNLYTVARTLAQPVTRYLLFKQVTWNNGDYILSNKGNNNGVMQGDSTPKVKAFGNLAYSPQKDLALDTWGVLIATFNGANSTISINNADESTGEYGNATVDEVSLGATITGSFASNIAVVEEIETDEADTAGEKAEMYAYLKAKYPTYSLP